MRLTRAVAESFTAFCDWAGIPLFDHQRQDFGDALRRENGRFVHHIAGISWPRGEGKSFAAADVGLWRLLAGKAPADIISVALDLDGGRVVMDHARHIIRGHPELERAIEIRANSLIVPATGSRWTVESREHTSTRGRHPTDVIYDEVAWAKDDELFSSLLAGQASVADPLMLVVSTVGRRRSGPLWTIKALSEAGDPAVFWRWSGENRSPKVTKEFLDRQRRILLPGQFAREHQNVWIDAADSFATAQHVDAAMGRDGWTEQHAGRRNTSYCYFIDIGTVHDPTVIGVGHREQHQTYIDTLRTFQGSREEPVQLVAVEQALVDLATRFRPAKMKIESWQGVSAVQSLQRLGFPVEIVTPTQKTNSEQWPLLAQKVTAGTLTLFPHARLREELLNLVYEVTAQGVRVTDRGKLHQDHAVVVRGLVAMLDSAAFPLSLESTNRALQSMANSRRPCPWGIVGSPDPTAVFTPVRNYVDDSTQDQDGGVTHTDRMGGD